MFFLSISSVLVDYRSIYLVISYKKQKKSFHLLEFTLLSTIQQITKRVIYKLNSKTKVPSVSRNCLKISNKTGETSKYPQNQFKWKDVSPEENTINIYIFVKNIFMDKIWNQCIIMGSKPCINSSARRSPWIIEGWLITMRSSASRDSEDESSLSIIYIKSFVSIM